MIFGALGVRLGTMDNRVWFVDGPGHSLYLRTKFDDCSFSRCPPKFKWFT